MRNDVVDGLNVSRNNRSSKEYENFNKVVQNDQSCFAEI